MTRDNTTPAATDKELKRLLVLVLVSDSRGFG